MAESLELSSQECEDLLRAGVAGRIAVSTPGGPHIIPVNYSVVDGAIVVRTSPYSLLGTHGRNTVLAFEVDHFDHEQQHGWSVVARGRGRGRHRHATSSSTSAPSGRPGPGRPEPATSTSGSRGASSPAAASAPAGPCSRSHRSCAGCPS